MQPQMHREMAHRHSRSASSLLALKISRIDLGDHHLRRPRPGLIRPPLPIELRTVWPRGIARNARSTRRSLRCAASAPVPLPRDGNCAPAPPPGPAFRLRGKQASGLGREEHFAQRMITSVTPPPHHPHRQAQRPKGRDLIVRTPAHRATISSCSVVTRLLKRSHCLGV